MVKCENVPSLDTGGVNPSVNLAAWQRSYGADVRRLRARLAAGEMDFALFEMVEGR